MCSAPQFPLEGLWCLKCQLNMVPCGEEWSYHQCPYMNRCRCWGGIAGLRRGEYMKEPYVKTRFWWFVFRQSFSSFVGSPAVVPGLVTKCNCPPPSVASDVASYNQLPTLPSPPPIRHHLCVFRMRSLHHLHPHLLHLSAYHPRR
jgi:hypothetical protein